MSERALEVRVCGIGPEELLSTSKKCSESGVHSNVDKSLED
jgi:hypothetical protein